MLRNRELVALLGSVLEFKAKLGLLLLSQQDLRGLENSVQGADDLLLCW